MKKKARKPKKRAKQTTTAIVKRVEPQVMSIPQAIEKVLIQGDLSPLTPQERVDYYKRVCDSLGLNPLTMPFSYILFKEYDAGTAKLSLYANKSCTEQLRKIHGVSIVPPFRRVRQGDIITVEVDVRDKTGRTDTASGSVPTYKIKDGKRIDLDGKDLCNADMKCETKAKRRATLSICGLAVLDESELDTMQVVGGVTPDGRIFHYKEADTLTDGSYGEGAAVAARKVDELRNKLGNAQEIVKSPGNAKQATFKPDLTKPGPVPANMGEPVPVQMAYKGTVEIDHATESAPIVRGDIAELLELIQKHCTATWGKDEFWHVLPKDVETIRAMCLQLGYAVSEKVPKAPPKAAPTEPPASDEPVVAVGTVERVAPGTAKNGAAMRHVTIAMDGKKPSYGCFIKDIFPYLDDAKGPIEAYVSSSGKWLNLDGLKSIVTTKGLIRFDSDGKTPIVQRSEQEAGQKTLY